jgi:phosphotransferase system HPr-like phosphotransfer protein
MSETKIFLKEIDDVKEFVNLVMLESYDVDLVSGRYAVDAKSIMGIFSLDLSEPVVLKAHTDDADELFEKLEAKGYIVK